MPRLHASVLVITFSILPCVAHAQSGAEVARRYRQSHEAEILADFAKLLALPNVATDSANIRANARHIAAALSALGVKAELWQRPGAPPIVFGELRVTGAQRTLALYAHYDGQPVNAKEWKATSPWQPALYSRATESGGQRIALPKPGEAVDPEARIYARSAGDDKAPIAALLTVLRAGVAPTFNVKILLDGEEEAGSPHLRDYLEEHRAQLADVDAWLFFDGPVHASGRPQIAFGVRGITGLEITLYGAVRLLHSGLYGNWAPNPALMLARLLASMKDENGRVVIEGFYDSVAPIGAEERAALAALPDYDAALKRELGIVTADGSGKSLPEALLQPSLNIRGFTSANTGAAVANVIPSTATASVDIRLVKGNDPDKMVELVEKFIAKQGYHIVREDPDMQTRLAHAKIAKVTGEAGYPASRAPMSHPLLQQVVAAARAVAGDQLVLLPSMGGSLPLYLFADVLGKPVIVMPIANYDDNQHAPDENLRIGNLWYGIELIGAVLTMPVARAVQ
jgi:acetylornithine deacetylase/succinyl-diaminopimelate desuccinylase-like protein